MTIQNFSPSRAIIDDGRLIFDDSGNMLAALRDGFFALKIPEKIDLTSGQKLGRQFYLDVESDVDDEAYRGFRKMENIYFDREHFQTEHILIDSDQRQRLFPILLNTLCCQMHELARMILREILASIGIPPSLWSRGTGGVVDGGGISWFAASHYRSNLDKPGAPAHKDTGFITVLYCNQSGLEALVNGTWYSLEYLPGYFLINFGGSLEILTARLEKRAEAILHRVRQCQVEPNQEDRYSFAAFLNPSVAGNLYQISDGGQNLIPFGSVETFLRDFNQKTWQDDHANFGISEHFSEPNLEDFGKKSMMKRTDQNGKDF
jgi:isopenicillin N synthase-like dioxygenase